MSLMIVQPELPQSDAAAKAGRTSRERSEGITDGYSRILPTRNGCPIVMTGTGLVGNPEAKAGVISLCL